MRRGVPLPETIQNAPQLYPGLDLYLEAFIELSTSRPWGFGGPLPIPWSTIREYARDLEIEGDDFPYFLRMIRELDGVFLEHAETKSGNTN